MAARIDRLVERLTHPRKKDTVVIDPEHLVLRSSQQVWAEHPEEPSIQSLIRHRPIETGLRALRMVWDLAQPQQAASAAGTPFHTEALLQQQHDLVVAIETMQRQPAWALTRDDAVSVNTVVAVLAAHCHYLQRAMERFPPPLSITSQAHR